MLRATPSRLAPFVLALACSRDVVLADDPSSSVCGDGVVQLGEECDVESPGCSACQVVPTWSCPNNVCAVICGDPSDGVVGDAPGCQSPRRDVDCDMTGYWVARETSFVRDTILNSVQTTSTWALFRFSQTGDAFQVEEHISCANHTSGSATVDPTPGALRGFLEHNRQDPKGKHGPRKGTFKAIGGACAYAIDRWYEVHGITEDLLPADFSQHPELSTLPKIPSETDPVHPTKQNWAGAIDWDGDGSVGFGALVTGVANGTRHMSDRSWLEFATPPNKPVPPKALSFVVPGAWDLEESVLSVSDCGSACGLIAAGAYAAKDLAARVTMLYLGKALSSSRVASVIKAPLRAAVETDLATCARARLALPHETSLTPP